MCGCHGDVYCSPTCPTALMSEMMRLLSLISLHREAGGEA